MPKAPGPRFGALGNALPGSWRFWGLSAPASQANFLLAQVPGEARLTAWELYLALKERGILVRYFDAPRLKDKLRITIGTPEQNARLVSELAALLR